jgi:hypothetical protein
MMVGVVVFWFSVFVPRGHKLRAHPTWLLGSSTTHHGYTGHEMHDEPGRVGTFFVPTRKINLNP